MQGTSQSQSVACWYCNTKYVRFAMHLSNLFGAWCPTKRAVQRSNVNSSVTIFPPAILSSFSILNVSLHWFGTSS